MALLHHNANTHTKANVFDVFRECNAEANLTFRYEECTGSRLYKYIYSTMRIYCYSNIGYGEVNLFSPLSLSVMYYIMCIMHDSCEKN